MPVLPRRMREVVRRAGEFQFRGEGQGREKLGDFHWWNSREGRSTVLARPCGSGHKLALLGGEEGQSPGI